MLTTVLFTATTLLAGQSLRAAPAEVWAPTGEPFCEAERQVFDPVASFTTDTEAPEGGAWWLQRQTEFFTEDELLDDPDRLELVAGDGTVLDAELHVTTSALALLVPEDAGQGATFLLRDRLDPSFGRVLTVGPPMERAAQRTDIELAVAAPRLASCSAECDDGFEYEVPAAPRFTVQFDGPPVILDAWHRTPGDLSDLNNEDPDLALLALPRLLDSRLMEDGGPRELEADRAGGELGSHLHVQLRDPLTLELLHEEDLSLDGVLPRFDSSALVSCEEIGGGGEPTPSGGYYAGGCHSTGGAAPSALGLLLLGLAARRRRR